MSHISRLVDDLLDVSRIASGKVLLRLRPLEIGEVLAKAIEMVSPRLEQRAHHLAATVPRRGLTVSGDPVRLAQVFANLLTNAAKYTQAKGELSLTAAREGTQVVVRLKDNGAGIETRLLQNIFERRILLVDDNVDACVLLAEILRGEGHEVEVAHDGIEAIAILARFDAEVFVLDLGLPVMDGFQLACRIRAMERGHPIRLIALSGYGQEKDRRRSHDAGFDQHLVKPASLEEVMSAVDGGA